MSATEDPRVSYDINIPYKDPAAGSKTTTPYLEYLPTWEPVFFEPLQPFEYFDPGLRAKRSPSSKDGLRNGKFTPIQPKLGTIVENVSLANLTSGDKDALARLMCERKVLVFPDQEDFLVLGPTKQQEWKNHFGKPHYQPVSGCVKGFPGFHIIHRDGNKDEIDTFMSSRTTTCLWHQDVSFEIQPPGYAMLAMLQGPEVGGDTVFAATDEAYK
jgi:sulfonate dioxygenase